MPHTKTHIQTWLCFMVASTCLAACTGGPPEEKMPPAPVRVERLENRLVSEKITLVGWMDSRKAVDLFPRVTGYVSKIYVTAGQSVNAGQLMLEVDPTRQKASVASAMSEVETAKADLEKEKGDLKSLQSGVAAEKAKLDYESLQFNRYYWLHENDVVAQAMVDTSNTSKKVAQANLQALTDKIDAQKSAVESAYKKLQDAKSKLVEQQTILGYYYIRAPFTGTVGDVPVKEGDYVDSKTQLTSTSQIKPLEVNANIPKAYASQLRPGLDLELMDTAGNTVAHCPIFYVAPTIDPRSQSVQVKGSFSNARGVFRPAQSVEVTLVLSKQYGLTLPTESLYFMAGKPFVFTAEKDKDGHMTAKQYPVNLGSVEESRAILISGLQPGAMVIVSGVQNLFDGAPIKIEQ